MARRNRAQKAVTVVVESSASRAAAQKQPKKKGPPPKKQPKQKGRAGGRPNPRKCMGAACAAYCLSICNPRAFAARLPIGPMRASSVCTTRLRGTLNTGSTGFAGILVNPFATLFRDVNSVWLTVAANDVAGTDTMGVVAATKFAATQMPAPFTASDFTDATAATAPITGRARLVSLGIYAEYAGPPLYQSGQFGYGYQPDGVTLTSTTIDAVLGQSWVALTPLNDVNGRGVVARYLPTDMDNTDYLSAEELAAGVYAARDLFVVLSGGPTSVGSAIRFEVVANWEVFLPTKLTAAAGGTARSENIVSTPDSMGAQDIIAAVADAAQRTAAAAGMDARSIAEDVARYAAERVPTYDGHSLASLAAAGAGAAASTALLGLRHAMQGRHAWQDRALPA